MCILHFVGYKVMIQYMYTTHSDQIGVVSIHISLNTFKEKLLFKNK